MDALFGLRILAVDAAHVPGTALARESVFALSQNPSPI
jgi:hypothetical protein